MSRTTPATPGLLTIVLHFLHFLLATLPQPFSSMYQTSKIVTFTVYIPTAPSFLYRLFYHIEFWCVIIYTLYLCPGDEILSVNGMSLEEMSYSETISIFKDIAQGTVNMHLDRRGNLAKRLNTTIFQINNMVVFWRSMVQWYWCAHIGVNSLVNCNELDVKSSLSVMTEKETSNHRW